MNPYVMTMLQYLVGNDVKRARESAKAFLQSNKIQKDQPFCEKLLSQMEKQDQGIEIPYNLKSIIQTKCTPYDFQDQRYFLTRREQELLSHLQRMHKVGNEMAELNLHYTNAVLLSGRSGTGKTTFAQYVAHHLQLPFLYVSITQLIDSYLGKTGQNMELVFQFASSTPCVLVLDEIDQIGTKRGEDNGVSGEIKRVLISVLQNLDKLPNNVVLIAATNRPEAIDPALVRRFPMKHEILPFAIEESKLFISQYLDSIGLEWKGEAESFLQTVPSVQIPNGRGEPHYTVASLTDCMNERIAKALESAGARCVDLTGSAR